ncbi:MAG: hypothetical protein WC718_09610 [Phycisphaerales bacterium]|jgi:hypothetical protein
MSTLNVRTPTTTPMSKNALSPHPREQPRAGVGGAGIAPQASRPPTANPEVTPERIRARAYETFQARQKSGTAGDAVSDWLCAEQECRCGKGRGMETQGRGQPPGLDTRPDPPLIDPGVAHARQQLRPGL